MYGLGALCKWSHLILIKFFKVGNICSHPIDEEIEAQKDWVVFLRPEP